MDDKKTFTNQEFCRLKKMLRAYLSQSEWDERMNIKRERWLWPSGFPSSLPEDTSGAFLVWIIDAELQGVEGQGDFLKSILLPLPGSGAGEGVGGGTDTRRPPRQMNLV